MTCPEILRTQAFLDGEIEGDEAVGAEAHIAGCADCQAFCADAASLSDAIRTTVPRYAAPAALKRRVWAALDAEDAARMVDVQPYSRKPDRGAFWRGALGGAGITGIAATLAVLALLPPSAASLADQVTSAHTRALMDGQLIQVASSDHHTVKPWFAGKIALSPPVTDLKDQGFRLAGGRLDKAAGSPAAVLVYEHGRHKIDLFVWADRGSRLPEASIRHGYRSMFWKSGDLAYAAVSDVGPAELQAFTQLIRAQPE